MGAALGTGAAEETGAEEGSEEGALGTEVAAVSGEVGAEEAATTTAHQQRPGMPPGSVQRPSYCQQSPHSRPLRPELYFEHAALHEACCRDYGGWARQTGDQDTEHAPGARLLRPFVHDVYRPARPAACKDRHDCPMTQLPLLVHPPS